MTSYEITLRFDVDDETMEGDEPALAFEHVMEFWTGSERIRLNAVSGLRYGKLMEVTTGPGGGRKVAPCPWDTNDDGDCGRPLCPQCGDPTGRRRR